LNDILTVIDNQIAMITTLLKVPQSSEDVTHTLLGKLQMAQRIRDLILSTPKEDPCKNCVGPSLATSRGITDMRIRKETPYTPNNYEYFFGDRLIVDSITLLTYDNHQRKECREFKETLKHMTSNQMREWLQSPHTSKWNW
jgi:hypothetical protein